MEGTGRDAWTLGVGSAAAASAVAILGLARGDPEALAPARFRVVHRHSSELVEELLLGDYLEIIGRDYFVLVVRLVQSQAPVGPTSANACDIDPDYGVGPLVLQGLLDLFVGQGGDGDHCEEFLSLWSWPAGLLLIRGPCRAEIT
jgi:hypothetical protein